MCRAPGPPMVTGPAVPHIKWRLLRLLTATPGILKLKVDSWHCRHKKKSRTWLLGSCSTGEESGRHEDQTHWIPSSSPFSVVIATGAAVSQLEEVGSITS